MPKPLILLTNDDGFYAAGMEALHRRLKETADVVVVAPDRERSAASMALTLHNPMRLDKISDGIFSLSGTPVDCVYMAVQMILPRKPDLVISGINPGPNLGQQDIAYSGTVGGAVQGTFLGIPSFAVSLMRDAGKRFDFGFAADFAAETAAKILGNGLPRGITLNINIPPPPVKGTRLVKLGEKRYNPEIIERRDPRNRLYYWLGTGTPKAVGDEDSDVFVIKKGFITITPIHRDSTHFPSLDTADTARRIGIEDHESS